VLLLATMTLIMGKGIQAQDTEKKEEKKPALTGEYNSTFSAKNTPLGYIVGKGPHHKSTLSSSWKGFNTFIWQDYDIGDQKLLERDYGVNYEKDVNKKTSVNFGYTYWNYIGGGHDNVISLGLNHSGNVNSGLSYLYFFEKEESKPAHAFKVNISKNYGLTDKLTLTPSVEAACIKNTFGGDTGFSNVNAGLNLDYILNNHFTVSGFVNGQLGFIHETASGFPIDNAMNCGLSIDASF